jgi:zinc protease
VADSLSVLTTLKMQNGLTVLASEVPGSPLFTAMLVVEAGARFDPRGGSGLASMVGRLLVEGSEGIAADELALATDSVGSSLEVVTGYETTAVIVTGLTEHCADSLAVMARLIDRPLFAEPVVLEARRRHLAELSQDEDTAASVCAREFLRTVFQGHPRQYPVDGISEDVAGLGAEQLRAFFDERFLPAASLVAVAAGLPVESISASVGEAFGDWSSGRIPSPPPPPPVRQSDLRVKTVRMESRQMHVSMGNLAIPRSSELYLAAEVMDVILGDTSGHGSRLSTRLREERGLAYVVESDSTGTAGLEPGVFRAYGATSPERFEQLVEGILSELRLIRTEPPTEDEVSSAVAYLQGRHLLERETVEARVGHAVHSYRHGLGPDYDLLYPEAVESVTRDDVLAAAREIIDTEAYSLVAVGPLEAELPRFGD